MDKVIVENFRCFKRRQEVVLKPLTLLVGENSTGKSSFLAAIALAPAVGGDERNLNFNREPFNLGAFDQIASYAGGRSGRAKSFTIGYHLGDDRSGEPIEAIGTFVSRTGQPDLQRLQVRRGQTLFAVRQCGNSDAAVMSLTVGGKAPPIPIPVVTRGYPFTICSFGFMLDILGVGKIPPTVPRDEVKGLDAAITRLLRFSQKGPYSIAPVRTRPERTYDPKSDIPRPEGNHVPMVLAQAALAEPILWAQLRKKLSTFGRLCGLFLDIEIKRKGRSASDPFQILFKVSGASANLMDIGYGVSRVLPILVDVLTRERENLFLMQQPEVHLHPRAQAELGSFLGHITSREKKRFVVETHSDHLIDRICLDIRDKKTGLTPDDVSILYFERENSWVKIHPIRIDENGNIQGAPPGYRSFFLKEQARVLGL